MDISGITSQYIDNVSQKSTTGEKIKGAVSSTDYSKSTDADMLKACKQFEAYFLEQVYKEMQKTVDCFKSEEGSTFTTGITDFFKEQTVQQVTEDLTEKQGLGLAQDLYEQMKRNYGI